MADRIITVTDPSVVTNDTLSGYNNYSDIDGQLGTTMTPTEATNGHTVALSDGVVHEVTTKPVGTTNGEFSAVVSNAVTVDLSSGGLSPIVFTSLVDLSESGELYTDTSGVDYQGNAIRASGIAGDFVMEMNVEDIAYHGAMIGIKNAANNGAWNGAVEERVIRGVLWQNDTGGVQAVNNGGNSSSDVQTTLTGTAGDKLRMTRVGNAFKLYHVNGASETLIHTFPDYTITPVYPAIYAVANKSVFEPRISE